MRYVVFGVAFLLFVFAAVSYYIKKRSPGPPAPVDLIETTIRFSTKLLDVGEKKLNTSVQGNFIVYNTGRSNLFIEGVLPDCHCTVANYSNAAIAPGDSGVITLKYDSTRRGPFQSSAEVATNSKPSPTLIIFRDMWNEGLETDLLRL